MNTVKQLKQNISNNDNDDCFPSSVTKYEIKLQKQFSFERGFSPGKGNACQSKRMYHSAFEKWPKSALKRDPKSCEKVSKNDDALLYLNFELSFDKSYYRSHTATFRKLKFILIKFLFKLNFENLSPPPSPLTTTTTKWKSSTCF